MDTITISVKNLGPLAEGEVELRPLTLFVGPSNTGKSYMATAIWAVTQAFQEVAPPASRAFASASRRSRYRRGGLLYENSDALNALQDWVELPDSTFNEFSGFAVKDLPEAAQKAVQLSVLQLMSGVPAAISDQLRQAYGDDVKFAKDNRPEDFLLAVKRNEPLLKMDARLTEPGMTSPISFDVSKALLSSVEFRSQRIRARVRESGNESEILAEEILIAALVAARATVSSGFPRDSYYLPAARSGIAQAHKVLAAALARQSRRIGIEQIDIPPLPGMTTEFLVYLLDLDKDMDNLRPLSDPMADAVAFIENKVLGGQIDLDESSGLPLPEIVYLPGPAKSPTGKYTLDHTSSMVSELAPVVLFLKYLVRPGDLLIFEEPESHLHPAAQLRLAQGIARLVNAGVKVLITTHSGDFVDQLNNLISMSNSSRKAAAELGLAQEECLKPEQVSAYGFRFDAALGDCISEPLPVGADVGIEDQEFPPVSELLYEQAITLQRNRLE